MHDTSSHNVALQFPHDLIPAAHGILHSIKGKLDSSGWSGKVRIESPFGACPTFSQASHGSPAGVLACGCSKAWVNRRYCRSRPSTGGCSYSVWECFTRASQQPACFPRPLQTQIQFRCPSNTYHDAGSVYWQDNPYHFGCTICSFARTALRSITGARPTCLSALNDHSATLVIAVFRTGVLHSFCLNDYTSKFHVCFSRISLDYADF